MNLSRLYLGRAALVGGAASLVMITLAVILGLLSLCIADCSAGRVLAGRIAYGLSLGVIPVSTGALLAGAVALTPSRRGEGTTEAWVGVLLALTQVALVLYLWLGLNPPW